MRSWPTPISTPDTRHYDASSAEALPRRRRVPYAPAVTPDDPGDPAHERAPHEPAPEASADSTPAGEPSAAATLVAGAPQERVARGLLLSLVAILGGIVLAVIIWRLGYIAAISSLVIAAGAVALYPIGAGAAPRRGLAPLVAMILVGVTVSFFAIVASDLYDVWDVVVAPSVDQYGAGGFPTRVEFIRDNITNGEVLSSYGKDLAWFVGFTALGIVGTLRRLFADR